MENNVLYQIKTLEKMIFRNILTEEEEMHELEDKPKIIPTPTQMEIIMYIIKNEDRQIYQKELENALKLRRATVSGVLQTMEKNGLIERVTDSKDSRTKRIVLKQETKIIFENNKRKFDEIEKKLTKGISKDKINYFLEIIETMKKNMQI